MAALYQLFIFLVLLITCSVEGSFYCIADCEDNNQQSSLCLQYCCHPSNKGKGFKIQDEMGDKNYIFCPSIPPTLCPLIRSCSQLHEVYPTAPSGYYNITLSNGSKVEVYCDMEGSHCDGEGGWTRVAFVNMSKPGSPCPPGLVQYDNIFDISLCWTISGKYNNHYTGCNSTLFSSYGLNYTKVCGQVRGYQYGYPAGFYCYINNYTCFDPQIKTFGVTLTYSNNPRKHIWTYAAGHDEQGTSPSDCPCNNGSQYMNYTIPFVGNDYYCESGRGVGESSYILYSNDPLWDGEDCPGHETTCCTSPKMPWFVKTLNETVNDDIELNVCGSGCTYNCYWFSVYGTAIDLIELYIK